MSSGVVYMTNERGTRTVAEPRGTPQEQIREKEKGLSLTRKERYDKIRFKPV